MQDQTTDPLLLNAYKGEARVPFPIETENWRDYIAVRDKVYERIYNAERRSLENMIRCMERNKREEKEREANKG